MLRSQRYLADLGSEEQECSRARSPQREVRGGLAKCCNASERLGGRFYSTLNCVQTKTNEQYLCGVFFNMNWWDGADLVHPAIVLGLLLNAACFIFHWSAQLLVGISSGVNFSQGFFQFFVPIKGVFSFFFNVNNIIIIIITIWIGWC